MPDNDAHNQFEKAVITMMLAGDDPVLETLHRQYARSTVTKRMFSGVGFVTDFALPPDIDLARAKGLFFISDIGADLNREKGAAGLHLQIKSGRLKVLEGFTYSSPWPVYLQDYSLYYKYPPTLEALYPNRDPSTPLLDPIAKEWRKD